jgi:4'-phosphopantetheinyl transferase
VAEVIVYWFRLDDPPGDAVSCLSPDESLRRDRFFHARDRARFAAGRTALRGILALHTGIAAPVLVFEYGKYGRPALAQASAPIDFNLSHSDDLGALALSNHCRVGLDLEVPRDFARYYAEAAADVLRPEELAVVDASPPSERSRLFLAYWTAKESVLKLLGSGLNTHPAEIAVDLPTCKAHVGGDSFHLQPLRVPGAIATLATGEPTVIRLIAYRTSELNCRRPITGALRPLA